MKKMIPACALLLFISWCTTSQDPLQNTSWQGTFFTPDPTEGMMIFKTDTLKVMIGSELLETMTYTTMGDTLSIVKVAGMSPCSPEAGLYSYTMKADQLSLKPIKDACLERVGAFSSKGYDRKK